ncbi:MAG: hypothetical protein ACOH13_00530 [Flavobacteriales bacterium]
MMRFYILSLSLIAAITSAAQKQGNIWYFGIQAGLDFNTPEPTPLLDGQTYTPLPNLWNEGTSSICDSSGALLFYSNGEKAWNNDQQIMLNGDSLMGHASSTHSILIVPRPASDRYFYMFTTDGFENNFENGLRFSVVDMCLDDGSGGVVTGQKNVLLASTMAEKLAAVRHANGTDYWVLAHGFGSNAFLAYLLTSTGITDTVRSNIGVVDTYGGGGQMVLSPDGSRLAYAYPSLLGSLNLFDFDIATGIVSNARTHQNQIDDQSYGLGFSPSGSKLYVTTVNWGKVYQYDLSLGSWEQSISARTLLAAENPDSWRDVKLGPDNKIYLSKAQRYYLARIEEPDMAGVSCQYVDEAVYLGGRQASFGLPAHVADYAYSNTSVKDCSGEVGITEAVQQTPFVRYTGHGVLSIELENEIPRAELLLFDAMGRSCGSFRIPKGGRTLIQLGSLSNGVYHVIILPVAEGLLRASFIVSDGS